MCQPVPEPAPAGGVESAMPHRFPAIPALAALALVAAACGSGAEAGSPPQQPAPAAAPTAPAAATLTLHPCAAMKVSLDDAAVVIAGERVNARVVHAGGAVDSAALDSALQPCDGGGGGTLEVAGQPTYQHVVTVMDVFIKHGLDLTIDGPDLPGLAQQPTLPPVRKPAAGTLQSAPVLLITGGAAGTITLSGAGASPIALATRPALDDAAARKLYDALVAFRGASADAGAVIIQADASTPSPAVVRATAAASAAGFHVLFAIKDR